MPYTAGAPIIPFAGGVGLGGYGNPFAFGGGFGGGFGGYGGGFGGGLGYGGGFGGLGGYGLGGLGYGGLGGFGGFGGPLNYMPFPAPVPPLLPRQDVAYHSNWVNDTWGSLHSAMPFIPSPPGWHSRHYPEQAGYYGSSYGYYA